MENKGLVLSTEAVVYKIEPLTPVHTFSNQQEIAEHRALQDCNLKRKSCSLKCGSVPYNEDLNPENDTLNLKPKLWDLKKGLGT